MGIKADNQDLKLLKAQFQSIDKNNDGTLTVDEFKLAQKSIPGLKIKQNKWEDVLKECDLDGNGSIDFAEFKAAAINKQKLLTKENLLTAFKTFDINNDGKIDISEFKEILPSSKSDKKARKSTKIRSDSTQTVGLEADDTI